MNGRIEELVRRYPALVECAGDMEAAFAVFRDAFSRGGKALLAGNGGSAADAEHWSGELLKGFAHKRPLPRQWRDKLPADLASRLQGALPAIPLSGFSSLSTAFGNDVDPEYAYAQLVWALGAPGDVLVGISTSGNARNVCRAADVAKARGLSIVALTGRSGGCLAPMASVAIRVPEAETFKIQELHLPVYHCLCLMIEDEFFGAAPVAPPAP